jgi:hypothetical protein
MPKITSIARKNGVASCASLVSNGPNFGETPSLYHFDFTKRSARVLIKPEYMNAVITGMKAIFGDAIF